MKQASKKLVKARLDKLQPVENCPCAEYRGRSLGFARDRARAQKRAKA